MVINWRDKEGGFHALIVHCVPSLQYEQTAEPTEFPLETGASASDHVIQKPDRVTFEMIQTETPIDDFDGQEIEFAAAADVLRYEMDSVQKEFPYRESLFQPIGLLWVTTGIGNAVGSLFGATEDNTLKTYVLVPKDDSLGRINDLLEQLSLVKRNVHEVTINYLGYTYTPYYITSLNYNRTSEGEIGRFSMEMQNILTVNAASNLATPLPNPAEQRYKQETDKGNKPVTEEEVKLKSVAAQGYDGLVSGLGL